MKSVQIIQEKTLCFTGHRPEKLKREKYSVIQKLNAAIDSAIDNGYDTFINGLAPGVDLWAGGIIADKKAKGQPLKLISAKPYPDFEKDLPEYFKVIENSDEVIMVSNDIPDKDLDEAFIARDKWMVDNSSLVIAVYDGVDGGTKNTVEYAELKGIKVIYL